MPNALIGPLDQFILQDLFSEYFAAPINKPSNCFYLA